MSSVEWRDWDLSSSFLERERMTRLLATTTQTIACLSISIEVGDRRPSRQRCTWPPYVGRRLNQRCGIGRTIWILLIFRRRGTVGISQLVLPRIRSCFEFRLFGITNTTWLKQRMDASITVIKNPFPAEEFFLLVFHLSNIVVLTVYCEGGVPDHTPLANMTLTVEPYSTKAGQVHILQCPDNAVYSFDALGEINVAVFS